MQKSLSKSFLNPLVIIFVFSALIIGLFLGALYQKNNSKTTKQSVLVDDGYVSYPTATIPVSSEENEVRSAELVSTRDWKEVKLDDLSFKIPSQAEAKIHNYPETCQDNFDRCYRINNHDPNDQFQGIEIAVKPYLGGSRRVEAGLVGVFEYENIKIGSYDALEAVFICQIDSCTPSRRVLIVIGNKLISIQDSTYLDKSKGGDGTEKNPWSASLESSITNTIISTLN